MKFPHSKTEITRVVLAAIGDDPNNPWKDKPIEKLVFAWFQTGRQGDNLRLSEEGARAFEYAKIQHFDFPVATDEISSRWTWYKYIFAINKKLQSPYYLGGSEGKVRYPFLRIYDDKIAVIITLHGSVNDFMQTGIL